MTEFEKRIALEKDIVNSFKKLSKKTEKEIMDDRKKTELNNIASLHPFEYYADNVYNPQEFPDNFDVEFEIVRSGYKNESNDEYKKKKDKWNWYKTHTSSLKTGLPPGMKIQILVKEKNTKQYIGLISLSGITVGLKDRDSFIGWDHGTKYSPLYKKKNGTVKRLDFILDISTCVPLQPFGRNFNGGKLLALLCFSEEIQDLCHDIYGHYIAGFQTMGVNGHSAMYDRLNLEKGGKYYIKEIGQSAGHGVTSLIPTELADKCCQYLKMRDDEAIRPGSMYRAKLLKLRTCMKHLNIDYSFLDTDAKKGIYFGFTSNEAKEFLIGNTENFEKPKLFSTSEICKKWLDRWAKQRFINRKKFKTFSVSDISLHQQQKIDTTNYNTARVKAWREKKKENESEADRKILKRKQNNRSNLRKFLNKQSLTYEQAEEILNGISEKDISTLTCSKLIDNIQLKHNFPKCKNVVKGGYTLKDGWGTLYLIRNMINDKKYIGQVLHFRTKRKIPTGFAIRMKEHEKSIEKVKVKCAPIISNAINAYGWDKFEKYPLLDCRAENMDFFEKKFIIEYNSHISKHGYNATWGGQDNGGQNWRTGVNHHHFGKKLDSDHKNKISISTIITKRKITDDHLYEILDYKHSQHKENDIVKLFMDKYKVKIDRSLIESIWNGECQPLDSSKKPNNYESKILKKRIKPSGKKSEDNIIEFIFNLKFKNMNAESASLLASENFNDKIEIPFVYKIWSLQLRPSFPSDNYNKLLDNDKKGLKPRNLNDHQIEEIYFLKNTMSRKETETYSKQNIKDNITVRHISSIWNKQMVPLLPTNKYIELSKKDIIKKKTGSLLNDDQITEIFDMKGQRSSKEIIELFNTKYSIEIKKSMVSDIWTGRKKRKQCDNIKDNDKNKKIKI